MINIETLIKHRYLIVLMFVVFSFFITYNSISAAENLKYEARQVTDKLSGEEYNTAGIYNYKDNNPYGSYFTGFDQLIDRGVRNEEWLYISDTLTNFTMYNKKIYNGKISFVKDSFVRNPQKDTFSSYSYKFGINDGNIHTMDVESSWVQELIRISIRDNSGDEKFFKEFKMY